MIKVDAIRTIADEFRTDRMSTTALKRVRKAGKVLGLTNEEQIELEQCLDYRNSDGNVFPRWG